MNKVTINESDRLEKKEQAGPEQVWDWYVCECGIANITVEYNFCPMCGSELEFPFANK